MEREKALDMALGQIERQFGKGAIMRMDEQAKVKIPAIPTGALSLDLALGIGGLPRGRVVEIYGPESSGKCVPADTYVWTDRGMETVAELFQRCGQKASCTSRTTDITDLGVRAVNERGELEHVAALTHNNRRPVLRLRLQSGRTVTVTHNHPLRVVDEQGFIVWRTAQHIATGDFLVSAAFGAVEAAGDDGLGEDEAALLGYLVAEGSLSERSAIRFTSWDPEVGEDFTRLMQGLFEAEVRCYYGKEYAVPGKALREEFAERYGLDYVTAAGKTVPHGIRTGGDKVQRAFLSALFEGDGWIDGSSTIGFASASEQLAREVQLLLYGLGVPATVSSEYNAKYERHYWTVTLNSAVAHRFLDEVGFRSARRQAQVEQHFRRSSREPQCENVPHLSSMLRNLRDDLGGDRALSKLLEDLLRTDTSLACSRQRLERIVEWVDRREGPLPSTSRAIMEYLRSLVDNRYTYEKVVAVEDAGLQPTFDLSLPRTHSFLANGVLSHNTTVALHAIAEAQKAGGIAAFIDAEHALDPTYAAALGVDIEALLVSQPDTGEQALEIADMLIRSGAIDMLVVDSVAALTPRAEIEGEMGDSHVGLQARLMSQALRKLAGTLNRSKTCAIFVNQIREKVGVMFGCMNYQTRVTLADGSQEKIGKIVTQRLPVEVLSYDAEAGRVVPRKVTSWFDNGPTDEFLTFEVARGSGNGRAQFACTPDHEIRTPGGWRRARELDVGDRVLQSVPHYLSDFQWEVVLGALLGDGALSATRSGHGARLRWGHGRSQAEYADWKASLLTNVGTSRSTDERGAVFHDAEPLAELAELRRAVHIGGRKVLSYDYLKRLTPLSLAVWYMDDASLAIRPRDGRRGRADICVEALEPTSRARLVEYLRDEWGITCRPGSRAGKAVLQFRQDETERLHALIAPFVHPSMEDKLLPRYRGQFSVEPDFAPVRFELAPMPIAAKAPTPAPKDRVPHRYDIEVEGTHNYFVDGVMVHNSPETQPGGRALKFYSSVRLDVRRIESLKDGTDFVGNRVRVKVVKNKCVAAGTKVFDPTSGLTHAVEDIVDHGEGAAVWAVDKRGEFHVRDIGERFDQGEQDVIDIRLRGGAALSVTPDHPVLTEQGWQQAGELAPGDRVARPRRAGGFGDHCPVPASHARMLGYLIGDGYVGDKTPIAFVHTEPTLHEDASRIAAELGCKTTLKQDGRSASFSHRPGERNELLALARWAGIWGHLAPKKRIPAPFFAPDVAEEVIANLLFGIWESGGWISCEQPGGLQCGFVTTSEQLAWQIHWLLLRWGISSAVSVQEPRDRRSLIAGRRVQTELPCWQVRISGIDNVERLSEALPMWGPRGRTLIAELDDPALAKHRGGRSAYLSSAHREPVLAYLEKRGVSAVTAASILGVSAAHAQAGLRAVLGSPRLRRDRVEKLAAALDSAFLREVLADELYYERIHSISDPHPARTFDIEVDELHNLVANGIVVHNCAPPFKQAEFDILFGEGISKEGSILDVGVDQGIVKKAGAWYTYEGEQLGQGRENARQFLKEHDDVSAEIYKKVTERLGLVPTDVAGDQAAEPEDG